MAGGQERILRRRIRSVQSTRKITKAMELIAASQIVRAQDRIAANRPYREGMERILRLTAAADPHRGREAARHARIAAARRRPGHRRRPRPGRLVQLGRAARHRAPGGRAAARTAPRSTVWSVGKKAPSLLPLPRHRDGPVVHRLRRPTRVRRRPPHRCRVAAPFLAGEIDLVQMVSTRFFSAGRPAGRADAAAAAAAARGATRRRRRRRGGAPRGLHRVRARAREAADRAGAPGARGRDLRRAARGRGRRSSPPSSGPWRPPPRTRTSSSAP